MTENQPPETINLKRFCEPDCKYGEPFSHGDYSYATNGHILVRVPRLPGIMREPPMEISKLEALELEPSHKGEWYDVPELPEKQGCAFCRGSGKVAFCGECDGEGIVTLHTKWHEYECECKGCRGEGFTYGYSDTCPYCDGAGWVFHLNEIMKVGEELVNARYIEKIRSLPNPRLFLPANDMRMVVFRFDGGVGGLMAMTRAD